MAARLQPLPHPESALQPPPPPGHFPVEGVGADHGRQGRGGAVDGVHPGSPAGSRPLRRPLLAFRPYRVAPW